jgi:RimJ/RimL family protein N-acetyltransferase
MEVLRSEFIEIAPLDLNSISNAYLQTLNDHEYMRFSRHSNLVATRESQIEYFSAFNSFDSWIFGITLIESRTLVGTTNLYFDYSNRTISLGFLVFKEYSGKGIARQTLSLMSTYLARTFPGFNILIGTKKSNAPMRRVVESSNFQVQVETPGTNFETIIYSREIPALSESAEPEIPALVRWARNICVAANDAGGAEQIAWLARKINHRIKAYLDGPAIRVFAGSGINFEPITSLGELIKSDLVITGSGWMSPLENEVIRFCRKEDIPCLTLLDHWVNFKERFLKEPVAEPQMLAVTNLPALTLANQTFKGKSIWLLPDFQIDTYKASIKVTNTRSKVLVLMEPSPTLSLEFCITLEMEYALIEKAVQIKETNGFESVEIRLHPSQALGSQNSSKLRKRFPGILISNKKDLVDDLSDSALVLGFSSYGLYISAMCGIDTRSYFAGAPNHWTAQFKSTIRALDHS